ncbi:MAG: malto-oligosyltrehalose trehalohydrolase [Actinobacteria bacterium]|nr:malto-oligosyltrehalose trehalohydrolase [Actinomycetota bacterium]MCG2801635.1 malto-oligosyltrehalose trehalohydrolase [Cellulomonas sp.]
MIPRVWAPAAREVALVTTTRTPLRARTDGWWVADRELAHGTDYAFSVDDGPARPDPRSPWQPAGVHGPSRVFDVGRHPWTDGGWRGVDAAGAVTYELHVGTFTPDGTLDAAAGRLDHLADLGVDLVELMPLAAFDGRHGWGYDGVDLYAVHEPYGGPQALQRFVDAAHGLGLGVCLDVVYNHLGPSGNYLRDFGPYFTDTHTTPWGDAVNLDGPGADEVRRFLCDNALRWFSDFHLDALRLDAVHALVDTSPRHLLAQLSDEVAALARDLGRPLSLVAESDLNDPTSLVPTAQGGWAMTAQWADDVHHAVHALVTGERQGYYVDFGSPQVLRHALRRAFVHEGQLSTFRGTPWGRPVPDALDGHRFVVAATNHDQVGNRALGDRPSARLRPAVLAGEAALVVLAPFSPMLFMGEEWGAATPFQYFTDHTDPALAAAVRDGRRAEFADHGTRQLYGEAVQVPDPQDPGTFVASRLDWSEPAQPAHARLLGWYRTLIALRRVVPDLARGDRAACDLVAEPEVGSAGPFDGWLVVLRGQARVVVNLADAPARVLVPAAGRPLRVVASWDPVTLDQDGAEVCVVMPGTGVTILA